MAPNRRPLVRMVRRARRPVAAQPILGEIPGPSRGGATLQDLLGSRVLPLTPGAGGPMERPEAPGLLTPPRWWPRLPGPGGAPWAPGGGVPGLGGPGSTRHIPWHGDPGLGYRTDRPSTHPGYGLAGRLVRKYQFTRRDAVRAAALANAGRLGRVNQFVRGLPGAGNGALDELTGLAFAIRRGRV